MEHPPPQRSFSGITLVELCIGMLVAILVLFGFAVTMHREARGLARLAERSVATRGAGAMLGRIQKELEHAIGATPQAILMTDLGPATTSGFTLDTTLGFPAFGMVLLDAGTAAEERIAYDRLVPSFNRLEGLGRGAQCGSNQFHTKNAQVSWAGMATPIDNQLNPAAGDFDGVALEASRQVFFRGDGTGFSYRTPTDPTGAGEYFEGDAITWGANIAGTDTLEGWSALYYEPVGELREDSIRRDIDGDGDTEDVYDLGRIRMVSWNAFTDNLRRTDVALCPPFVLQRRCDWGGDLDGDGFDDPIFLWDASRSRLSLTLFVIPNRSVPRITPRLLESTLYLRNGAWE